MTRYGTQTGRLKYVIANTEKCRIKQIQIPHECTTDQELAGTIFEEVTQHYKHR